jgi:acetyl esterase/lipase
VKYLANVCCSRLQPCVRGALKGRRSEGPCFVHLHGGYWQRGSKEIFACLSEGPLARGWSAALCGYTLAPEASLTQITNELKSAFDWLMSSYKFIPIVRPTGG